MNLDSQLDRLETAQLLRRVGDEASTYAFRHTLTQDVAYASLLHTHRREIHRQVARAYEAEYGDQCLDEYAGILAQHYAEASDDEQTVIYATRAGDLAARVYANAEAIKYYSLALTSALKNPTTKNGTVQHLYLQRGRMYQLASEFDRALANYSEMEAIAHQRVDRALELAALMARATIHSTPTAKFDPRLASELGERSLALAQELNDQPARAKVLWNLMLLHHFQQRYSEAIAYGEQSIALARQLNLREQLAYSLNDISRAYFTQHQSDAAFKAAAEANEIWRDLGNKPMLADNLGTMANGHYNAGDYDRALKVADEAFQLAQEIGNVWSQSFTLMMPAQVYWDRGEIERAIGTMQDCLRLGWQAGFSIAIGMMLFTLARTFAGMGNIAKGFEFLDQIRIAPVPPIWRTSILTMSAHFYLLQGQVSQAREMIQQFQVLAQSQTLDSISTIMGLRIQTELALAEHDYANAFALSNALLNSLDTINGPVSNSVYILYLKGRTLVGLGNFDQAEQTLNRALAEARRVGIRQLEWQILAALSDLALQCANADQAKVYRVQGREIVEFIAEHSPPDLRESFLYLPDVRKVMAG